MEVMAKPVTFEGLKHKKQGQDHGKNMVLALLFVGLKQKF